MSESGSRPLRRTLLGNARGEDASVAAAEPASNREAADSLMQNAGGDRGFAFLSLLGGSSGLGGATLRERLALEP